MDGTLVADAILVGVVIAAVGLLMRRRFLFGVGVGATGSALWISYLGPTWTIPAAIPLLVVGLGALGWGIARRSPDPPTIWNK
jgi:hypothetical protein